MMALQSLIQGNFPRNIPGNFKVSASLHEGRRAYGKSSNSKSAKLLQNVVEEMQTSNKYLGSIMRDAERQRTEFSKLAQMLEGSRDADMSPEKVKGEEEIVVRGKGLKVDVGTLGLHEYPGEAGERYGTGHGSTDSQRSKFERGSGAENASPMKYVEGSGDENSERDDYSDGHDDEDLEGPDDEDSEGTDYEDSEGTDYEDSEGTDDEDSEGTDDDDLEGTCDEGLEGTCEGIDAYDEDMKDENLSVEKRHGKFVATVQKYLANRGALLKCLTGCKVGIAGDFVFKYKNLEPVVDKTNWPDSLAPRHVYPDVHLIFLKESRVAILQVEHQRVTREAIAQLRWGG